MTLPIKLMWGEQELNCNQALPALPQWRLENIQFYLSNFKNSGRPLYLVDDGHLTQQKGLALLGSDCRSDGQWQLVFERTLEPGEFSFNLGVPFKLNHQAPLTAQPPLNQSDMFWTWQMGHKFFRLDLAKNEPKQGEVSVQTGWQFHLGSTGCKSASVMRAPTERCSYPNRPRFALNYQGETELVLDLAPLLSDALQNQVLTLNSCMSDPHTLICKELLPKIGINSSSKIWRWQS
ncbi:MbnP family copper-binding protein [Shewanella woodyi]|uniref:MbnP family copper-binding protein n=1 Tax=Shewanella woodyi TaxID=60961 RepID=UPI00374A6593